MTAEMNDQASFNCPSTTPPTPTATNAASEPTPTRDHHQSSDSSDTHSSCEDTNSTIATHCDRSQQVGLDGLDQLNNNCASGEDFELLPLTFADVESPCGHNYWDNRRIKKPKATLQCRQCRHIWRVLEPLRLACKDFHENNGNCPLGASCPYVHLNRWKSRHSRFKVPMQRPADPELRSIARALIEEKGEGTPASVVAKQALAILSERRGGETFDPTLPPPPSPPAIRPLMGNVQVTVGARSQEGGALHGLGHQQHQPLNPPLHQPTTALIQSPHHGALSGGPVTVISHPQPTAGFVAPHTANHAAMFAPPPPQPVQIIHLVGDAQQQQHPAPPHIQQVAPVTTTVGMNNQQFCAVPHHPAPAEVSQQQPQQVIIINQGLQQQQQPPTAQLVQAVEVPTHQLPTGTNFSA